MPEQKPDDRADYLRVEYSEVNSNFRALSEIRFKLLAFVPTLGGAAIYVLSIAGISRESQPHVPIFLDYWVILFLSALGFLANLGIVFYDQRNSELYNALIHRAKHLEVLFRLPRSPGMPLTSSDAGGQFNERLKRSRKFLGLALMSHDKGLSLIYGPILGAWFFPIILSVTKLTGYQDACSFSIAIGTTIVLGLLFTIELFRQDTADYERWHLAASVEAKATASNKMSQ